MRLVWRMAEERIEAREELVEHDASSEAVGLVAGGQALELLGRHIGVGAAQAAAALVAIAEGIVAASQTKIEHLHEGAGPGVFHQEHVCRFDVAVDDALCMGGAEGQGQLAHHLDGDRPGQGAFGDGFSEVLTDQSFHHEPEVVAVAAEVVDGNNVRVAQAGNKSGFIFEPATRLGIERDVAPHDLDDDFAPEASVVGDEDEALAAVAEQRLQFVAAADRVTGDQTIRHLLHTPRAAEHGHCAKERGSGLAVSRKNLRAPGVGVSATAGGCCASNRQFRHGACFADRMINRVWRGMTHKDHSQTETVPVITDPEVLRAQLPPRAALQIYHRNGNTVLTLSPNDAVTVGRSAPSDVIIDDPSISRVHACFYFDGERVEVEDRGSTNGTRVNGELQTPRVRCVIGATDEVTVGNVMVVIHRLTRGEQRPMGFDSHERLTENLREEIARARHFRRSVSLMFIAAKDGGHVSTFAPDVQKLLRPVDRVALYSPQVLEVLLPERDGTRALAEQIVGVRKDLVIGVVVYPEEGDNVDRMIDAAKNALKLARSEKGNVFVVDSGPRDVVVGAADAPLALTEEMVRLFGVVDRCAKSTLPVLVRGQTGSGKEVVAQAIHSRGSRAARPLICLNCGSLPASLIESTFFGYVKGAFTGADKDTKGVFESAEGGTLFLDEIGELPEEAQTRLLRVLESRIITRVGAPAKEIPVDVRIVAATHRDLEEMVAAGTFRTDLLYRLNALTLQVPPLCERRAEIPALAARFMARADEARRLEGFDDDAMAALQAYDWPGNVRELRNAVDRAVVLANERRITLDDLPDAVRKAAAAAAGRPARANETLRMPLVAPAPTPRPSPAVSPPRTDHRSLLRAAEARLIIEALDACGGVQTRAAQRLQMSPRTLVYRLRVLGIRRDDKVYVYDENAAEPDADPES